MSESLKRVSMVLLALAITLGLSGVLTLGLTKSASADREKVLICHRDNNVKKPYGPKAIKVNASAVDGEGNNDHTSHTGPVATSVEKAQELKDAKIKWGDIIPPVEGVTEGLNWDAKGQAIWENDCQVPEQEPRFFQFAKEWKGDAFDKTNVKVTFTAMVDGKPFAWTVGQAPVQVVPGETTLINLEEEVTGLPTNCKVTATDPVFPVKSLTAPADLSLYTGEDRVFTYPVTNTVDCEETPVTPVTPEGETETPVTPVTTTTQVTATPTGAVDAGAGADLVASLAGLMGSAGVVAAGVFLRRFSVVSL